MPLDLSKLQNVRMAPNGARTAACPACLEDGHDHSRDHLIIYHDGKYGCIANQGDEAHRSRIYALAGMDKDGEGSPTFEMPPEPRVTLPKSWSPKVLDRLVKDYSYWEGRGISAATVAPFRGGIAATGQLMNRWVFPIFGESEDVIIGFTGRALRPTMQVKWKHLAPSATFLWGGMDEVRESRRAILVESIGDSLMLREHGVPESIVLFGLNMSPAVLAFLVSANPESIIISTNRDENPAKGQRAAAKIQATLLKFFNEECVSVVLPPEGVDADGRAIKDWGQCSREQVQAAFGGAKAPDSGSADDLQA